MDLRNQARGGRARGRRSCHIESLEQRQLLAVTIDLLKDVNDTQMESGAAHFALAEDSFYFSGIADVGYALFKSDGTPQGTRKVADLPAEPSVIGNVKGTAYFSIDQPATGSELWISDGTAAGTRLLKDLVPGPGDSEPHSFVPYKDSVLFLAGDSTGGRHLWKSDGTEQGTEIVRREIGEFRHATDFGAFMIFSNDDALWRTDGMAAGTSVVSNDAAVDEAANPAVLPVFDGISYFISGGNLWRSDGTDPGTYRLPLALDSIVSFFAWDGGFLLAEGASKIAPSGYHVWKTDGTPHGSEVLQTFSSPNRPLFFDGKDSVFVYGDDPALGSNWGLWSVPKGVGQPVYLGPKDINLNRKSVESYAGKLYWTDARSGELHLSDGTLAGTSAFVDVPPLDQASAPHEFFVFRDQLYFLANDSVHGDELWRTDGTKVGTELFFEVNQNTLDAAVTSFTVSGDRVFFAARDELNSTALAGNSLGEELYVWDETLPGARLVKDIVPGAGSSFPQRLTDVNGTLFFFAAGGLWKSNGTANGTALIKAFSPTAFFGNTPTANANGVFYFTYDNGAHGSELWRSDGTTVGTYLVKDLFGLQGSNPTLLTSLGNTLYFRARDTKSGYELWKSDGTDAGTVLVADLTPGIADSPLSDLTIFGGRLYFVLHRSPSSDELWMSDGTAEGTKLVRSFEVSSNPLGKVGALTVFGNRLAFRGPTPNLGAELWLSDGTAMGTIRLRDAVPNSQFFGPQAITGVGSSLYFTAAEGGRRKLWITDGTARGTARLRDFDDPIYSTANVAGTLTVLADAGTMVELWMSSGTEASTIKVASFDRAPTFLAHPPMQSWRRGVFFAAKDQRFGFEPRRVEISANTPSVTGAMTLWELQTPSGLVVKRNPADGNEVSYVKVTNIVGGTLYLNDGTTPVGEGYFVPLEEAAQGFKFTPIPSDSCSFTVQASTSPSDVGLGGETVTTYIRVIPRPGTFSDDKFTLRASSDRESLELHNDNAAPGAEPWISWPVHGNVPLPIDLSEGNDTIVVDLPEGLSGPLGHLKFDGGSGANQLIVRGGSIRVDSVATGGTLNTIVEAGSHVTMSRLNQQSLTLTGNGNLILLPGGNTSVITSVHLDANATLDVTDIALVINHTGTSAADAVREKILSGRGRAGFGASWDGTGITSSAVAQANANEPEAWSVGYAENGALPLGAYTTFRGVAVDETAVLIAFTRTGDANLDGMVDDADVTIVSANYAPGAPNANWAMGDFDYNGFVDDGDVTLLGVFYEPGVAPPAAAKYEGRITNDEGEASESGGGVSGEALAGLGEGDSPILLRGLRKIGTVPGVVSGEGRSTKYGVHGTEYEGQGTEYEVQSTKYERQSTEYGVHGTEYEGQRTRRGGQAAYEGQSTNYGVPATAAVAVTLGDDEALIELLAGAIAAEANRHGANPFEVRLVAREEADDGFRLWSE